ncbi:hypothetical protein DFH09DRAFT_1346839 [Mycena vulgaris]|nr:hypothetical protein DFH09DRAFT_1346839 [Mycena vulgaris]
MPLRIPSVIFTSTAAEIPAAGMTGRAHITAFPPPNMDVSKPYAVINQTIHFTPYPTHPGTPKEESQVLRALLRIKGYQHKLPTAEKVLVTHQGWTSFRLPLVDSGPPTTADLEHFEELVTAYIARRIPDREPTPQITSPPSGIILSPTMTGCAHVTAFPPSTMDVTKPYAVVDRILYFTPHPMAPGIPMEEAIVLKALLQVRGYEPMLPTGDKPVSRIAVTYDGYTCLRVPLVSRGAPTTAQIKNLDDLVTAYIERRVVPDGDSAGTTLPLPGSRKFSTGDHSQPPTAPIFTWGTSTYHAGGLYADTQGTNGIADHCGREFT